VTVYVSVARPSTLVTVTTTEFGPSARARGLDVAPLPTATPSTAIVESASAACGVTVMALTATDRSTPYAEVSASNVGANAPVEMPRPLRYGRGRHPRSVVGVGGSCSYCVTVQTVRLAHARSLVGVGAVTSNSLALQVRTGAHTRSLVAVGGATSNWTAVQAVIGAHTRSEVAVGSTRSYCPMAQMVNGLQRRSLVAVAGVDANCSAVQTVSVLQARSDVVVGAVD
jgi:hypothetical protein